jgi:hypothetical protein
VIDLFENRCSNPRHPNGQWHRATPLPLWTLLNLKAILKWRRNIRVWGCGCDQY